MSIGISKKIEANVPCIRPDEFNDLIITSKEAQVSKPDPLIFDYALKQYTLCKDEVFFVAHDKDEIDGAVKFGIRVIEFNNYLGYETLASGKIRKFSEMINLFDLNQQGNYGKQTKRLL